VLRVITLGGLAVTHDERTLGRAAAQPRRLALLAVLARAGARGVTREDLLALFWPEAEDGDKARRALAQALYALRRDLGDDAAIAGTAALRLDPARVEVDAAAYADLVRRGAPDEAAALYRGPFLAGFRLPGAPEFERWVDEERRVLARDHARLLERLALAAEQAGDPAGAARRWRALAAAEPLDGRVAARLMAALEAAGDRAGALAHARVHAALVRQELDLSPDAQVAALAERLRQAPAPTATISVEPGATLAPRLPAMTPADEAVAREVVPPLAPPATSTAGPAFGRYSPEVAVAPDGRPPLDPVDTPLDTTARPPSASRRPAWRRWMRPAALLAAAAALSAGAFTVLPRPGTGPAWAAASVTGAVPTVAIGFIADFRGGRGDAARPLADMLATNLARAQAVRVVSSSRMYELLRQLGAADTAAGAFVSAARQAGARELVDGTLYTRPSGGLRLDLRRVDLATGTVRAALTLEGHDLFALADSGTAQLLAGLGAAGVPGSVADVTTRSEAAYRVYDQGVRAYMAGHPDSARALLDQALALDSGFAMAAYYQAMARYDRADRAQGLARAVRLADRASDRERLLIRARWASYMAVPAGRAYADSLVARFPAEVDGYLLGAAARADAGEHAAAWPLFGHAAAMDSLSFRAGPSTAPCGACVAMRGLAYSHAAAGAWDDAERAARRWTRAQPHDAAPWVALGELLGMRGRYDAARAALDSGVARDPRGGAAARWPLAKLELRRGRLDEAERIARGQVGFGPAGDRVTALWMLHHTLRQAGRAREAVVVARQYRALRDTLAGGRAYGGESFMLGASLADAGRAREAAALFDSVAAGQLRPGEDAWSLARVRPAVLNESAWGRYLVGDTASLGALADSLQRLGARHAWGTVRLLHHQVRALQWEARGRADSAAAAWQRALSASTLEFPRSRVMLGRALTRAGRPDAAIEALRPALHAYLDVAGAVPMAAVHDALADAWSRVPGPAARDSAAAHWRWVARAWQRADPAYAARAAYAQQRLAGRAP
jgi:DNA-binding SARP family transcriptional activator